MYLSALQHGWTPLIFAAYHGNLPLVHYLVEEAGATRSLADKHRGFNALQWARKREHEEIVSFLRGDTPAHTPRTLDTGPSWSKLRSLMTPTHRRMADGTVLAVKCWCTRLTIRCRKCQARIDKENEVKREAERKAYLQEQARQKHLRESAASKAPSMF